MEFPDPIYLIVSYVAGAVLTLIGALILRQNVRVNGPTSWLLLILLAPLPVLVSWNLTGLAMLTTSYALPTIGMTVILGVITVHWLLPAIIPDFQTDSFAASGCLAVMLGISVMIGGQVAGQFDGFFPQNEEVLFDRTADLSGNPLIDDIAR